MTHIQDLYLFIIILIFISPLQNIKIEKEGIQIKQNLLLNILLGIYIISSIISVIYTLPQAIEIANMGEYGALRQNVYNDMESIELYHSQFERICKNLSSYLSPFGMVWCFYQLTLPKYNVFFTYTILIVSVISTFASSSLVASRGMILTFAVKILTLYVLFEQYIPQKRKKIIFILAIPASFLLLTYTLAVTDSRFGDEANDSLFRYFGHSMLAFNNSIMGHMYDYANGRYFFKWIFDFIGIDSDINFTQLGSTHGTAFITFVGCFYIDFGPIGTILFAILFALTLRVITRKKHLRFSDLIIIAFFASWFIDGVFVVGRSQSLRWLMVFVVYFMVKFIESPIRKQFKM